MNHSQKVAIIKYFYTVDPNDKNFDLSNIDVAIRNSDYYIRPGETRRRFANNLDTILKTLGPDTPNYDEHTLGVNIAYLIKRYFDLDYFVTRLRPVKDFSDTTRLKNYLYKLSYGQLKEFIATILYCRHAYDLFFNNENSTNMWQTLNAKCIEKDSSVPGIWEPRYREFTAKHPLYQFEYLSKETVAQVFCEHIDKDIKLAEMVAKVFYKSGTKAAQQWLCDELARHWGVNCKSIKP